MNYVVYGGKRDEDASYTLINTMYYIMRETIRGI